MKNHWLINKIVAKGVPFWTLEIYESPESAIVPETVVAIDERPNLKIIESLEVDGVWKPILIIWEEFTATYTDAKFLEGHNHIRLLEVDGNTCGILRQYDKLGEHCESWVMGGLRMTDIDPKPDSLKATFVFQTATYIIEPKSA
jgi:hypothetical protein